MTDKAGEKLSHIAIGQLGEEIACSALRATGRKILYRNYRGPKGGELDIVARDHDILSFIEVKTRRKRTTSRPLDAVNKHKQQLIKRGATAWLNLLPDTDFQWRFDVVEVELTDGEVPEVTIVKEAFTE